MIINARVWWLQICNMVRWVALHVVPNIRPGLCLEKYGGGSVMIWAAISCFSAGPIITLNDTVTAIDYMGILGNQVLPVVQKFRNNDSKCSRWQFAHTQSQKCSVLVWGAWICISASSLTSAIAILHRTSVVSFREQGEKQIPFITCQATRRCRSWRLVHCSTTDYSELNESIPGRLQVVLQANGGPTLY